MSPPLIRNCIGLSGPKFLLGRRPKAVPADIPVSFPFPDFLPVTLVPFASGVEDWCQQRVIRQKQTELSSFSGVPIPGATTNTYKIAYDDLGQRLRAVVTYEDGFASGKIVASSIVLVPPGVEVTRVSSRITEGQKAQFGITATGVPAAGLTVKETVTDEGSFLRRTGPVSRRH